MDSSPPPFFVTRRPQREPRRELSSEAAWTADDRHVVSDAPWDDPAGRMTQYFPRAPQRSLMSPTLADVRPRSHSDHSPAATIASVPRAPLHSTPAHVQPSSPSLPSSTAKTRTRTRPSPYLTEQARIDIMARIRRGEKQADLAKEYNVSRAAITNLKQRRQMREMLERVAQPKRTRPEAVVARDNDQHHSDDTARAQRPSLAAGPPPSPVSVASRRLHLTSAAVQRLEVTLLDPTTPDEVFARAAQRHCRLLLEEALGWCLTLCSAPTARFDPVSIVFGTHEAVLLAEEMARMEPPGPQPAHVRSNSGSSTGNGQLQLMIRVPSCVIEKRPVLVLIDDLIDDLIAVDDRIAARQQSDGVYKTDAPGLPHRLTLLLHVLQFHGVDLSRIFLVLSFCSEDVSLQLERHFPGVYLAASRFVSSQTSIAKVAMLRSHQARHRQLMLEWVRSQDDCSSGNRVTTSQ
ncbi:hypothetical protein PINS_up019892 [Pythium insidiosum]|nr:hypothetical protein PINS_up019892 [Pythium insidiosum]